MADFTFIFSLTRPIALFIGIYFNYIKQAIKRPNFLFMPQMNCLHLFSKRYFSLIQPPLSETLGCIIWSQDGRRGLKTKQNICGLLKNNDSKVHTGNQTEVTLRTKA